MGKRWNEYSVLAVQDYFLGSFAGIDIVGFARAGNKSLALENTSRS